MLRFDDSPKRATNLSLNSKVLDTARELGMNISATVDALLAEAVQKRYWERWNEENKAAIEHYNARIEREGLPLAKYRQLPEGPLMARFDVYANPDAGERRHTPYFLDVQNNYIDHLATRVVVPLRRESVFGPCARNLNPVFTVAQDSVVLDTSALGAVPSSELRKVIAHLGESRAAVQEALDTLFGAY